MTFNSKQTDEITEGKTGVGPAPQSRGGAALAAGRHQSLEARAKSICRENDSSVKLMKTGKRTERAQDLAM